MAEDVTDAVRLTAGQTVHECGHRWQRACGGNYGRDLEKDQREAFADWRQAWYDVYNELIGGRITAIR